MLKKVLIGLGIVFGLIIVLMVTIPFFVDANKFRPQIEKIVAENTNADLELGDLKLSLWGGVHIGVSKLNLLERETHKPVLAMTDAKLEIPISSVFSGRPHIILEVQEPKIYVTAERDGKMNVQKIIKPSAFQGTPEQKAGGSSSAKALPFQLSFDVHDGYFRFADERKNTSTEVKGFDFKLQDFGLNKPFKFAFQSDLNISGINNLVLKGPMVLTGESEIDMNSGGFDKAHLMADVDLTGLTLRYGTLFNKSDKIPLKVATDLTASATDLDLKQAKVQLNDAYVEASGTVKGFSKPTLDLHVGSQHFVFDHWQALVEPLRRFDMKGAATFAVGVKGPLATMAYDGKATLSDVSMKVPGLVPRMTNLSTDLLFSNDAANLTHGALKLGDSDLSFNGSIRHFTKPVIVINVASQNLDVDQMLPKSSTTATSAAPPPALQKQMTDAEMEKQVKGPIDAMKKNPMARDTDLTANAKIKHIRVHGADIYNLNSQVTFKNLVLALTKATADAFKGQTSFSSTLDFRGSEPAYTAAGAVEGLDMNAAMTSQVPLAKDTVFGKAYAKFNIAGAGVTKTKVKQTLKGKGNFKLENGTWSAFQVLQTIGDKLKSIPGAQKALGGVQITGKFRQLKSDFTIADGQLRIQNMVADMDEANTTLTGAGFVDFDMNMDLNGHVIAPAGGDIPKDIRHADGRLDIPYEIACKANSPCLKYQKMVAVVGKAYLKKAGGDAVHKALDNINAPQPVKDILKGLPF